MRAELRHWFLQYQYELREATALATAPICVFGGVAMYILAPQSVKFAYVISLFLQSFINGAYYLCQKTERLRRSFRLAVAHSLFTQIVNIVGFGLSTWLLASDSRMAVEHLVIGFTFFAFMSALICDVSKSSYGISLVGAILHTSLGVLIWHHAQFNHLNAWVCLISGIDVYMYLYNFRRVVNLREQARVSFESRRLAAQNETLKRLAMEAELQLAKEIQESLAPPPASLVAGRNRVDFFHVPYGILGGDWFAAREIYPGRWAIVVADVTGKGVPAAMVVQSLQCLWAQTFSELAFDPKAWINMVNRTLFTLGSKQPHTLTLGLMILEEGTLSYYSAGHLPLYLVRDITNPETVEANGGGGGLLGIGPILEIEPTVVNLPNHGNYAVMLGTDGVFDWSVRKGRRKVFQLMTDLSNRGRDAIVDRDIGDDKILVLVRGGKLAA